MDLEHFNVDVVPLRLAPLGVDRLHHRHHVPHLLELRGLALALVDLPVLDHVPGKMLIGVFIGVLKRFGDE